MKKILLMAFSVFILVLAFTVMASAQEYTISTSDEFNAAFGSAVDGDTIVIKGDISAEIDFGKSITYIIDGGYTWTAGVASSQDGKIVNIYARNGNATFMPHTGMWMNSYESDIGSVSQTVWNMGSLDDSTLSFDLVKTNIRLMYGVKFLEINFKSGTVVKNCNNNDQRDTRYFIATTINIYENTEMYGIYVAPYRSFFDCTTLNIYGGEIHGCYFSEYGMALAKTVNMFGGKIHDIYLNFNNSGVVEGLFNNATLNMYGGEIYNNYVKATSTGAHSVLAGNKWLLGGSVHDNYVLTSWSATPTLNANGAYEIVDLDMSSAVDAGYGKNATTVCNYSVIFMDADSKVISAYLIGEGKFKSTIADATEVTVPKGYSWSSTFGSCVSVAPKVDEQGTYYVAREHKPSEDDFDCTTALLCGVCNCVIYEAENSHNIVESLTYENYCANGIYICDCINQGCTVKDERDESYGALFQMLGYSVPEVATSNVNVGMIQGFLINREAVALYEKINNASLSYGIVVAVEHILNGENPIVLKDGKAEKLLESVILYDVTSTQNNAFDVKITGINKDGTCPEQLDAKIVYCAYVSDGKAVRYIDDGNTYENAIAKSYNDVTK